MLIRLLIALPLLLLACDSDDDSDTNIEPAPTTEGREAQPPAAASPGATLVPGAGGLDEADLESAEAIGALLAGLTGLALGSVLDVNHDDRTLTVTLDQGESIAQSTDIDAMCMDLNQAIGLTELEVVLESSTGAELARCALTG